MGDTKLVNIVRLLTTYNFQIDLLPNNLKCVQCKLVLRDACQLPCCCRFCRVCIDDLIAKGGEFCQGDSEECADTPLSLFVSHYEANKRVLKLSVKCPHDGCMHKCQLTNMEEHLRECQRKSTECPFRELGCMQDKLAAEEMGGHLQHENLKHSEILIAMIATINSEIETLKRREETSSREIETLKQRDGASRREIETLKQRNQASSIEIEMLKQRDQVSSGEIEKLKQRDEASSREVETLKHELVLKDGQIRSIMDQMTHVQNENKLIKNDIKSIKEEKEDLASRMKILEEEIAERRENDELNNATRVIEHVDREISTVTRLIGSTKDELATDMQLVRADIGSIKKDICSVKSQAESRPAPVGLAQIDASFVWLIDDDVGNTPWGGAGRLSEFFTGAVHLYKYRLSSGNYHTGTATSALNYTFCIQLLIYAGPNDGQLMWPFEAKVVITVTDRDRHETCRSISRQCQIERPPDNSCRGSNYFKFLHSELKEAGLNLIGGVRVSCVIVPGAGQ